MNGQTMVCEGLRNDSVFSADGSVNTADGLWFVLHTRSRQEKTLAADLGAMGIAHYLPMLRRVRYYRRRKASVNLPLFPGYLFLRGTHEQAYAADRTGRVASLIKVADQQQLAWELRNIQKALSQQAPLDPFPALQEGVRVEVRRGPFRGLQGLIEGRSRSDRLILQIEILGSARSMEIDGALLECLS